MSRVTAIIIMIIVLINRCLSMTSSAPQKPMQMRAETAKFAYNGPGLRNFARLPNAALMLKLFFDTGVPYEAASFR
jgi:hypothetical protein